MTSFLRVDAVSKAFGPTQALRSVSFDVGPGRVAALLGGNGAGKSTLTRIVCGLMTPDEGRIEVAGQPATINSPRAAHRAGIRVVFQELSLCTNLSIVENFYLEFPERCRGWAWRRSAHAMAEKALADVFGDHGLEVRQQVGRLSLAEMQMVEIARAVSDPKLRLLILDEPTSSLDAHRAAQLLGFMRGLTRRGLLVIFIGHRLAEVLDVADEFLVLRDGQLVWSGPRRETDAAHLLRLLSAARDQPPGAQADLRSAATAVAGGGGRILAEIGPDWQTGKRAGWAGLRAGEVVGLAGLEGAGQQRLLRALFRPRRSTGVRRLADVAYVTGDRKKEGIFSGWFTESNIAITRHARGGPFASVSLARERAWARDWQERFQLSRGALGRPIVHLSGGNQQKALFSRALLADTAIVLLEDPTRGVDVGVKKTFYQVLRETVAEGKLAVWYSSEDAEFLECDRVLVFREGRIVRELRGIEASRENLMEAVLTEAGPGDPSVPSAGRVKVLPRWVIPAVALVAVLVAIGAYNPRALSPFGLGLLLSTAVPLVLVSLAQMSVVGRSEIDLGVGAFAGLANVISATVLVEHPLRGFFCLAAGLAGYGLLGLIVQLRRVPAIVATLGSSFVFLGLGYTIQPAPGGSAPGWLSQVFNVSVPFVPLPLVLIVAFLAAAGAGLRSRPGVVLRGFGNNPAALSQQGWSAVQTQVQTYVCAGVFATLAGLCLTGVNTASDVNAASSYTLLSVAAVVMGGCDLVGGNVSAVGTALAAVTLSLLGALLGFMQLSSDFIAAIQGLILIGIVLLRAALGVRAS